MQITLELHTTQELRSIAAALTNIAFMREQDDFTKAVVAAKDDWRGIAGNVPMYFDEPTKPDIIVAATTAGEPVLVEVIPAPNEPEPEPVATEELMAMMREAAGRAGLPAVAKLMEQYAATRVSDIPHDRSAAFAADLSSLTAAAA